VTTRATARARVRPLALIVTCEHGGNQVPRTCRSLFRGHGARLRTHGGYDIGAPTVARDLASAFDCELVLARVTRLLVDLNRSIGHPRLYSDVTRGLDPGARAELLADYYFPYRCRVRDLIAQRIAAGGRVLHVSSHSFTPALDGVVRGADIGLLYDPSRRAERHHAGRWQRALRAAAPNLRVRRNYPYAGRADGFTTALRRDFADRDYAGIELEVNQRYALAGGRDWRDVRRAIVVALRDVIKR
jgi:predicted N-formylglutamate amidohydrolase